MVLIVLALALVRRSRCGGFKAIVMSLFFGMYVVNNCNCRCFCHLPEDKLCLRFKLAPPVCCLTFPILASLLVRFVFILPFPIFRLSLQTHTKWTHYSLSVFFYSVVSWYLTLIEPYFVLISLIVTFMVNR